MNRFSRLLEIVREHDCLEPRIDHVVPLWTRVLDQAMVKNLYPQRWLDFRQNESLFHQNGGLFRQNGGRFRQNGGLFEPPNDCKSMFGSKTLISQFGFDYLEVIEPEDGFWCS